uniref:Uncharacterized protein n=1 Tax=Mustela putorius furo TaxID=9669 RepID=M3Z762_MUSPF
DQRTYYAKAQSFKISGDFFYGPAYTVCGWKGTRLYVLWRTRFCNSPCWNPSAISRRSGQSPFLSPARAQLPAPRARASTSPRRGAPCCLRRRRASSGPRPNRPVEPAEPKASRAPAGAETAASGSTTSPRPRALPSPRKTPLPHSPQPQPVTVPGLPPKRSALPRGASAPAAARPLASGLPPHDAVPSPSSAGSGGGAFPVPPPRRPVPVRGSWRARLPAPPSPVAPSGLSGTPTLREGGSPSPTEQPLALPRQTEPREALASHAPHPQPSPPTRAGDVSLPSQHPAREPTPPSPPAALSPPFPRLTQAQPSGLLKPAPTRAAPPRPFPSQPAVPPLGPQHWDALSGRSF